MRDLGRLDPNAVAQVTSEAWPLVRDADELHDALLSFGALPIADGQPWQAYFDQLRSGGRAACVQRASGPPLWVATERWPVVRALWPDAIVTPSVNAPAGVRQDWTREEAIVYLVRGRMECAGPITTAALAKTLGLEVTEVEFGLCSLENQGVVLRGRFTADAELEWCERRLLARIHRMTLEGLRRQIAPVSIEQYVRFLSGYQHVRPDAKLFGQPGLLSLIEQLEGFEAPAGHWEKHLLPGRLQSYEPSWLDALTFFGQAGWGRIRPLGASTARIAEGAISAGRPLKAFTRSTPIALMLRDHTPWLLPPVEGESQCAANLGGNAQAAHEAFLRHGALFPAQLGTLLQLLPAQVEDVLGELSAAGLVTSDGYPALRSLLGISARKSHRRRRLASLAASIPAGRWTLLRSALTPTPVNDERVQQWCRLLLRRYGVMFRDLLVNESAAPSWGDLVRTYRRLEARGEIRGGRFVAGVAGEQYALPEAIALLRAAGEQPDEAPLVLPATDPLNLTGRFGNSLRVPALPGHTIAITCGRVTPFDRTNPSPNTRLTPSLGISGRTNLSERLLVDAR
jgi:ATP-dependent Lhr-like helicase